MYLGAKVAETPVHLFCGAAEDAGTHEQMCVLDAKCAEMLELRTYLDVGRRRRWNTRTYVYL